MASFGNTNGIISANRLIGLDNPTVWTEFTPLSQKHNAVNLGQGFPDWEPPEFAKKAFVDAICSENCNQYCRPAGDLPFVTALAEHYGPLVGRAINPLTEVTVSVGATQALFSVMQALVNPNEEVLLLEPAFDVYPAVVAMAGGQSKYVAIKLDSATGSWQVDMEELEAAITPKTKMFLLNTPHNPTGKVFTRSELEAIAKILERHPHVIAVCDEVYENLVFDNKQHIRLASLPGMWERTITISSGGKTFSATGWKMGWLFGPAPYIKAVLGVNQHMNFCVSAPTQRAMARILKKAVEPYEGHTSYYAYICAEYERKRNMLVEALKVAGLTPAVPEGGFFVMADIGKYEVPKEYTEQPGPDGESPVTDDWGFARWLTVECGITPIPPSAFYTPQNKHLAKHLARFAFCKRDETLQAARELFEKMGAGQQEQKQQKQQEY